MCQAAPLSSCPTIKAGARLRRSRQWKDQSENKSPNEVPASPKKNARRRRRNSSNASSASSSDESSTSSDSCATPTKSTKQRKTPTQRRKRSKKSKNARPTKVVNIVAEPTEDEKAQYIGLDAEMVGIGPGGHESRLARVSLVNWDGDVVYDTHVQVVEKVTDYRTFVSGITEEDLLSEEAVSFDEAQSKVIELLQGKILVGHGLKNDFAVLGISLPWYSVRDTAKYEPFMKECDPASSPNGSGLAPKKLKVLAKDKLGMIIQEEGKPHSPVEDATAALELYKKHRGKWEKAMKYKMDKTREIAESTWIAAQ